MGTAVALALRLNTLSRTTLTGFDVMLSGGGHL